MLPEMPRRWFGLLARLAPLVGAGLASSSAAMGKDLDASAAPPEWVNYAHSATDAITEWLQAKSGTAIRFRSYLGQTRPDADGPSPPLFLKVWVDGDGTVSRISFVPFAHPEPNADLRALVSGHRLPRTPPEDMLQPLRLAIELDPHAGDDAPSE